MTVLTAIVTILGIYAIGVILTAFLIGLTNEYAMEGLQGLQTTFFVLTWPWQLLKMIPAIPFLLIAGPAHLGSWLRKRKNKEKYPEGTEQNREG